MPTNYSQDWFTPQIYVWERALTEFKDLPIKVLEIGSFEGRSAIWLLENILTHKDSKIVCVDPFKPYTDLQKENINWQEVEQRFLENTKPFKDKVELRKIESNELRKSDEQFDLIYIDGGHTSAQCLIDSIICHFLLKPRGMMIWDDYQWGGLVKAPNVPKPAVDAFMECFAEKYEVVTIGYQVILRKL